MTDSAVTRQSGAVDMLRDMMVIRGIEEALAKRPDHGFQLLSSGEEAVAVGVCSALRPDDQLLTGGRSIGPALARGVDPARLVAELLGKSAGTNRGKGGRGHLSDVGAGFFGAHAVVAGNISIAAGVALAKKLDKRGDVVAVLFGDGACGAGVLHETLNIAAVWRLPLLFVCNDNGLSVSTARADALAPQKLADLGAAFGLPSRTVDGTDVEEVSEAALEAIGSIRDGGGPAFLECRSHRLAAHSTTARETRSRDVLARLQTYCPIRRQAKGLRARGMLDAVAHAALDEHVRGVVVQAFAFADASPHPHPSDVLSDVG